MNVKKNLVFLSLCFLSLVLVAKAQSPDEKDTPLVISIESMGSKPYNNMESIESLIQRGEYDYISPEFLDSFKGEKRDSSRGVVKFCLIHCNFKVMSEYVLGFMESHGFRPATKRELLAWGYPKKYAEEDYHNVVALGDTIPLNNSSGIKLVTIIGRDHGYRNLIVNFFDKYWSSAHKFAAVKK